MLAYILHLVQALTLEAYVTDGKHFVNQHNFRFKVSCDSEGQPNVHPAAVVFDRRIEKFSDLGKVNNLIKLSRNLPASHSHNHAVEKDIFATSQFRMKASADFQETANSSIQFDSAG